MRFGEVVRVVVNVVISVLYAVELVEEGRVNVDLKKQEISENDHKQNRNTVRKNFYEHTGSYGHGITNKILKSTSKKEYITCTNTVFPESNGSRATNAVEKTKTKYKKIYR